AVPSPRTETARDAERTNREMSARQASAAGGTAPTAAGRGTAAGAMPTDNATRRQSMMRSEERLRAGTETVETGRVRLHKHVVTSQQTITVPIRREEVHVTREPIKPGEAGTSAEIGNEDLAVIMREERPLVTKETVVVERISLDIETVLENREVSGTIRREEIEVDDSTKRPRR
ncbi:MAG: YsnF/AvaK domain-containing protein, partial [Trebonia sp.]